MCNVIKILFYLCTIYNLEADINPFVQDGAHEYLNNIFDNDDLKVDLNISEDDYELIDKWSIEHLLIEDEDIIFHDFNEIVINEYEKTMDKKRADARIKDNLLESILTKTQNNNITTSTEAAGSPASQTRKINMTNEEVEFDYFMIEYAVNDTTIAEIYEPVNIEQSDSDFLDSLKRITSFDVDLNCTEQENGIGINAIKLSFTEFYTKHKSYKTLANNVWRIASIWIVVYLVIAIPLWFTKGACSCFLCCKFFKPQQTINEAKNYLLLNPPGTLVTKKGVIVHYEPTEREKDCYEEFVHFLRTL